MSGRTRRLTPGTRLPNHPSARGLQLTPPIRRTRSRWPSSSKKSSGLPAVGSIMAWSAADREPLCQNQALGGRVLFCAPPLSPHRLVLLIGLAPRALLARLHRLRARFAGRARARGRDRTRDPYGRFRGACTLAGAPRPLSLYDLRLLLSAQLVSPLDGPLRPPSPPARLRASAPAPRRRRHHLRPHRQWPFMLMLKWS
jgi:hypothetical protein